MLMHLWWLRNANWLFHHSLFLSFSNSGGGSDRQTHIRFRLRPGARRLDGGDGEQHFEQRAWLGWGLQTGLPQPRHALWRMGLLQLPRGLQPESTARGDGWGPREAVIVHSQRLLTDERGPPCPQRTPNHHPRLLQRGGIQLHSQPENQRTRPL